MIKKAIALIWMIGMVSWNLNCSDCVRCRKGIICNQLLVFFNKEVKLEEINNINNKIGVTILLYDRDLNMAILLLPKKISICDGMHYYESKKEVISVAPDTLVYPDSNDGG